MSTKTSRTDDSPEMKGSETALVRTVKQFIIREALIPAGGLVLAAVSGGQDSMAMLSILHRLSRPLRFRLAVGHFDHGLRDTGPADRSLVSSFAASLGLETHSGSAAVRELAKSRRESLEEAARKARYAFLTETARRLGVDRIAIGHTRTDQAETVLLHILRGTGLRGLAGIPVRRDQLIRPLLEIDRRATALYCRRRGIPIAPDPTNLDTRFARNRIRLELMPALQDFHPEVETNILRLAEHAREWLRLIRARTRPLADSSGRQTADGRWLLDLARLRELDDTSLVILFGDLFTETLGLDMDFTRNHFDALLALFRRPKASGKRLSLPGLLVTREYDSFLFTQREAKGGGLVALLEFEIPVPGVIRAGGRTIRTGLLDPEAVETGALSFNQRTAYLAYDQIEEPLTVRPPRPGDRIRPFGMKGSKKLSDIFIDRKIPGRDRSGSLVIADRTDILWLVGLITSEKGRIDRTTKKILKIDVDQE